jgi:hypothetical protein
MKNKEMDLVEGSTPSEMEKEAAEAGNIEALAPTARKREKELWMKMREPLGESTLKEGADVVVGK